jgi:hypothetical protein
MGDVPISDYVSITVTRDTQTVAESGFGVPLILGDNGSFDEGERVRTYSSAAAVLEDFASSDDEYRAAVAVFNQQPQVDEIKIGVEETRVAQVQTMTFSAALVISNTFNASVDGVALTPVPYNTSNTQTLTDIATALQATAGIATAVSDGTDTITITSATAGIPTVVSGAVVTGGASQATVEMDTTTPNHGLMDDLAEIAQFDDDWYGLVITERDEKHVLAVAEYIETTKKIFITVTDDADALSSVSTTDIIALIETNSFGRTAAMYNEAPEDFSDAAWFGRRFPLDPGTENWKFSRLVGITPSNLTSTQLQNIRNKNGNVYVRSGGNQFTDRGTMGSGDRIFIIRGQDWLEARLAERIFSRLVNSDKVPFTNAGIALIENEIRGVLSNAVTAGVLSGDPFDPDNSITEPFIVQSPNVLDISFNDRAQGILGTFTFKARFGNAADSVVVFGSLTV